MPDKASELVGSSSDPAGNSLADRIKLVRSTACSLERLPGASPGILVWILDTRFSTLSSSQFLRNPSPTSAGPSPPPRSLPWQPPHVRSYAFFPLEAWGAV